MSLPVFSRMYSREYKTCTRDMEELSKHYFHTPVEDMTPSNKRNMLYWCYATDVYHVRGWKNRRPLPPCLVFETRKKCPSDAGIPHEGHHDVISVSWLEVTSTSSCKDVCTHARLSYSSWPLRPDQQLQRHLMCMCVFLPSDMPCVYMSQRSI